MEEAFSISPAQTKFLNSLLDTRDISQAITISGISEDELEVLRASEDIGNWLAEQTVFRAKSRSLSKDHAKSLIYDVLYNNFPIGKNGVKLLELLGKWEGWSSERHIHSVDEGTKMAFIFEGKSGG